MLRHLLSAQLLDFPHRRTSFLVAHPVRELRGANHIREEDGDGAFGKLSWARRRRAAILGFRQQPGAVASTTSMGVARPADLAAEVDRG